MTLTIEPQLQQGGLAGADDAAAGRNNDGAVVVIQPSRPANVLAMVSNPTYDPNALVSTSLPAEQLAYFSYIQKDHEGFFPLRPIATGETFFPGSTMKVVTSHRGLQPQAVPGGLQLSGRSSARRSPTRTSRCATRAGRAAGR